MPRITHDSDIRHFRAKNMTHKKKRPVNYRSLHVNRILKILFCLLTSSTRTPKFISE